MGLGSVLVGVALALVTAAFVARPLRTPGKDGDLDELIERWVDLVDTASAGEAEPEPSDRDSDRLAADAPSVCYCPQCGYRVGPDARFCSRCGARLPEEDL